MTGIADNYTCVRLIFFCFLAKKDNSLPCATLFSNFSESKRLHSKVRKQKIFAAQTPPRKRGYVEDFTLKSVNAYRNPFASPKTQKSSFHIVHKAMLRNRRATSARMGLVSKHYSVNIMSNFYAMSRYGLRKLYFCYASIDFSVISQSTEQTFPPGSLTRDDYG